MIRWVESDEIRSRYVRMISEKFQESFSDYGILSDLVKDINNITLIQKPALYEKLLQQGERILFSQELSIYYVISNPVDLGIIRRIFAVMGLLPVGFYDLGSDGSSMPSTLFRSVHQASLKRQPFRIVLSLQTSVDDGVAEGSRLNLEDDFIDFICQFEKYHRLNEVDAEAFLIALMQQLHADVQASAWQQDDADAQKMQERQLPKVAIGHITLPCLNMEKTIHEIRHLGLQIVENFTAPFHRKYPILSNKINVLVKYCEDRKAEENSQVCQLQIMQRGIALTPKGLQLLDKIVQRIGMKMTQCHLSNVQKRRLVNQEFKHFPDTTEQLYQQGLAYFRFHVNPEIDDLDHSMQFESDLLQLVVSKCLLLSPIAFEEILQPDLNCSDATVFEQKQKIFEAYLGCLVRNPMLDYAQWQEDSLKHCLRILKQQSMPNAICHQH